jgi:ribosomal protein L3 glutamine methyltransferase
VTGADISADALAVARINVERHGLQERITLWPIRWPGRCAGPLRSGAVQPAVRQRPKHGALPAEYRAEPELALAGGADGMDFIRHAAARSACRLSPGGVLVLEIGNEREHFEAAFPQLEAVWLSTSAGDDQVLLLTSDALSALAQRPTPLP